MCGVAAKDARAIDCIIDTQLTTAIFEVLLTTVAEGGCGDERILWPINSSGGSEGETVKHDIGCGLICE